MIDTVIISEIIKIATGQIVETGDSTDKIEVDQGKNKIIEKEILGVTQEHIKILKDKIVEESTEMIIKMIMVEVEIGIGLEKDNFLETLVKEEVQVIVGPDQDQGQVLKRQNQVLQM